MATDGTKLHPGSTSGTSIFPRQSWSLQGGNFHNEMQSRVMKGVPACTPWPTETLGSRSTTTQQQCRRSLPTLDLVSTAPLMRLQPDANEAYISALSPTADHIEGYGLSKKRQRVMPKLAKTSHPDVHTHRMRARSRSVDFDITMKLAISVPIPQCDKCRNSPSSVSTITYDFDRDPGRGSRASSTTSLTGTRRKRSE